MRTKFKKITDFDYLIVFVNEIGINGLFSSRRHSHINKNGNGFS